MRRTPALALVASLVLAGCLGGAGGPPTPDGPPAAAWATGSGLNGTALVNAHFEALREAGSFTTNHTTSVAVDGDARIDRPWPDWYGPPRVTHERVDLTGSRLLHVSIVVGHRRSATFISPTVVVDRRRPCPPGECTWEYDFDRRPEGDTLHELIDRYRRDRIADRYVQVFDDWNFTYVGAEHRDGVVLYRYRANWTFDRPMHPFAAPPNGSGTLLVTGDGVIRRWETRFAGPADVVRDGETERVTVTRRNTYRYYAVGETSVERPAWVDRARAGHEPRRTETAER